jgi:hypothetical protein
LGPLLRVQIEFEVGSEPLRGRVRHEAGEELDFVGILELVALLDELNEAAQRPEADTL